MGKVKKKLNGDPSHQFPSKSEHIRNLSDAALSLSLQEEHSDVIFYCEGANNIVFAHKTMFMGRSDFLRTLFTINSKELYPAAKAHIYLPTVSKTAMTNLIKYLYQGKAVMDTSEEKDEVIELIRTLGIEIDLLRSSSEESPALMPQEVTPSTTNSKESPALMSQEVTPTTNSKESPAPMSQEVTPSTTKSKESPAPISQEVTPTTKSKESPAPMSQEVTKPILNSTQANIIRSEQNIDQNTTNDVVKELANFAEEMIAGMTRTYYERAKLLAGNDQSRVSMLNLSSTTAYIANITKLAAAQNSDSIAAKQPVTQEENTTEELVPEDRDDATNNRKSRGRPKRSDKNDGQKETSREKKNQSNISSQPSRRSSNLKPVQDPEYENAMDNSVKDILPVSVDANEIKAQEKGSLRRKRKLSDKEVKNDNGQVNETPAKRRGQQPKATQEIKTFEDSSKVQLKVTAESKRGCNENENEELLQNLNNERSKQEEKTREAPKKRGRKNAKTDDAATEKSLDTSKQEKKIDDKSEKVVETNRRGRRSHLEQERVEQEKKTTLVEEKAVNGIKSSSERQDENESTTDCERDKNIDKEQNMEIDTTENDETEEDEFEVEKILAKKGTGRKLVYLVKWKGYDKEEDNTWEPAKNLDQSISLIAEFEKSLKVAKGGETKSDTISAEKKTPTGGRSHAKTSLESESNVKKDKVNNKFTEIVKKHSDIVEDETTMCDFCTRIFLTSGAMASHIQEEHSVYKEEDISPNKDMGNCTKDQSISFSDSEDEVGKVKKDVAASFDDLFGGNDNDDIASGLVNDENIKSFIYNKDSDDESDDGKKNEVDLNKGDNVNDAEKQDDKAEGDEKKDGDEAKLNDVDNENDKNQ